MFYFCLHSLLREYGWQFIRHIALTHPLNTARALLQSTRLDLSPDLVTTSVEETDLMLGGPQSVVGVGFCLKPLTPPCISGRFNHQCRFLEHLSDYTDENTPNCCRQCAIREIGLEALTAGATFYIMTSAKDILHDLFRPALNDHRFNSGIFVLCRYSIGPFAVGLLASGIAGSLLAFEQGDCQNYSTWLSADRGTKNERTSINEQSRREITKLLSTAKPQQPPPQRFRWENNVLLPEN